MKKIFLLITGILICLSYGYGQDPVASAQSPKQTVAVANFDVIGIEVTPGQAGNVARLELGKLGIYNILDKYEMIELAQKENAKIENCYGKSCLQKLGGAIGVDAIISGTIETMGNQVVVSTRMVETSTGEYLQTHSIEFLNLPDQLPLMLRLTFQKMFNQPIDQALYNGLVKIEKYETTLNNPGRDFVSHGGPRMGVSVIHGQDAKRMMASEDLGGYDATPFFSQIGYQLEKQFLNRGRFHPLFEGILLLGGLDQGRIIPSLSLLMGVRDVKTGLEFGLGPTANLTKTAEGFFDENGIWRTHYDDDRSFYEDNLGNFPMEKVLDRRGSVTFASGFLFVVGKTFKSGRVNIPLNLWIKPAKKSFYWGLNFGFNIKGKANKSSPKKTE